MENVLKSNWYIVYTFPNLEKKIYNELTKKKIKAYLPLQNVIRQWSDRKKEIKVPMFPNYVFINSTERERFKLLKIGGVLKFITFEGKPAMVSEDEISNIMKFETMVFEIESNLVSGDEVIIVDGPFTGLQGKLFFKRGKERLGVHLSSINQSLSIEVCSTSLRKVINKNSYN
ncbi:UpxY family transcription antiterminator [Pedobacter panaciterrae]|jgi:Transcription antiterminator|uniref:UpxY family transcription antiterminator n=1 Tax=Pedobacter panaciterrae TaxID=363849 RepID=A0ABU8NM20_9SPHI|nr:UpxY family transcription antiterminator [Pedobacter panaciterrae]NQX56157.1 UpxY family transcription antiterminator [Pedobacter panaciterrae]